MAEVDGGWGVEAETGVAVLMVVPAEEALAERVGILDGAEPSSKFWAALERLELRLGVWIEAPIDVKQLERK